MKKLTLMGIGLAASIGQGVVAVISWRDIWALIEQLPPWVVWLALFWAVKSITDTSVRLIDLKALPDKGA